jgi:hypothetical protein
MTHMTLETDAFAFGVLIYEILNGAQLLRVADDILSGLLPPLGSLVNVEALFDWMAGAVTTGKPAFFRGDPNFRFVMEGLLSIDPTTRMSVIDAGSCITNSFNHIRRGPKHLDQTEICPYSFVLDSYEFDTISKKRVNAVKHLEYPKVATVSLAALPEGLESLVINGASGTSSDSISKLPSGFKLLSMTDLLHFPTDWVAKLPPTLEQLWLGQVSKNWHLSPSSPLTLPSTLHTLVVRDLAPNSMTLSYLPPTLTVLYAGSRADIGQSLPFNKLPPSLNCLGLPCVVNLTPLDASRLPRSLTTLSLPSLSVIVDEASFNLPHGLTFLDFRSCATVPTSSSFDFLTHLNLSTCLIQEEFLDSLPQTICNLSISSLLFSHSVPNCKFPKQLRSFAWCSRNVPLGQEILDIFPAGLTKLRVPFVTFGTADASCSLPSGLLYLDIPAAQVAVSSLPRGLTFLNAPSNTGTFGLSGIQHLPRGLTYLVLESAYDIPESAVAWLPPRLTFLNLASVTDFTDKCLPSLPRSLRSLNLSGCKKISNVTALPPNLISFKVGSFETRAAWNVIASAKINDTTPLRVI